MAQYKSVVKYLFFAPRAVSTAGVVNKRYYFCLLVLVVRLVVAQRVNEQQDFFVDTKRWM